MKQVIILSTLVAAATPTATELNSVDPYKKYEMQLDHAHASIAMTKAAIDEVKVMNETAIEDVAKEMEVIKKEAEKMHETMQLMSVVLEANNIEIPETYQEWYEDSLRQANMLKINKK